MLSAVYVPECACIDYDSPYECHKTKEIDCVYCIVPHHMELLIDGWYVGNENGFLTDDCYVAYLQTGIRVPVSKFVYDDWKNGFCELRKMVSRAGSLDLGIHNMEYVIEDDEYSVWVTKPTVTFRDDGLWIE